MLADKAGNSLTGCLEKSRFRRGAIDKANGVCFFAAIPVPGRHRVERGAWRELGLNER